MTPTTRNTGGPAARILSLARRALPIAATLSLCASALTAQVDPEALTGTFFKATASARLLVPTGFLGDGLAEGDSGTPDLSGKPKSVKLKSKFYFRIDAPEDAQSFEVTTFTLTPDGLVEWDDNGAIVFAGNSAILEDLYLCVPVYKKIGGEQTLIAELEFDLAAQIKATPVERVGESPEEGLPEPMDAFKKAKISTLGGDSQGLVIIDGEKAVGYGSGRVTAKVVPLSKVPPIAEIEM